MIRRTLTLLAAIAAVMALGGASASADTTHPFLKYINITSGGGVQPEGVDAQGNLIVWLNEQHAVAKYDTNGNPVNFSALGTNMIDGNGGHNCPATPSDCDRVPTTNGFTTETGNFNVTNVVAVDNSGGPANGYIYVLNNYVDVRGENQAEIDVFNAAGEYKGKIDESQVFPGRGGLSGYPQASISVASDGALYVVVPDAAITHVDRYVPVDGNPAHDQFNGQLRAACANAVCIASLAAFSGGAGGTKYFYASGFDATHKRKVSDPNSFYMRFPMSEFHRPGLLNFSVSDDFYPDVGPFGNSGFWPPIGGYLSVIAIDPQDQHVYIGGPQGGIQEWDENNHQVGPMFGTEGCPGNAPYPWSGCHVGAAMNTIAFDRSNGPNDGDIYVRGPESNQIAVFGPPVTIPDINHPEVTVSHTSAQLSANIGLAGGPPVTECRIDYGFNAPSSTETYSSSMPCSVATPYTSDTDVTADFSGLTAETDYHYRVVAKNSNGTNLTSDKVFHTVAVLGVHTDPATNLSRTGGDLNGSLNPDGIPTTYRFEYGVTAQYNNRTSEQSAGSGSGEESVSPESITGLQPGRTYHYRLVAKNSYGKTRSADTTFLVPANPTIAGLRATNVEERTAELNARINPLGYDTTYHFEYGTSPSYGNTTPDVDLGSQLEPQQVTVPISELPVGVIHFRVIAENEWGTTTSPDSVFTYLPPVCPNSHIRQETNANYLPDCRAYELVSPGSAGNVTLFPGEVTMGAAGGFNFGPEYSMTAPNAGGYASAPARFGYLGGEGAIAGLHAPNGLMDRYVATRTSNGWVTTYPGRKADETLVAARPLCDLAMDKCLDYRVLPLLSQNGGSASKAPYIWSVDGNFLERWPTNLSHVAGGDQGIADDMPSADFSHFVFNSTTTPFTPEGLEAPPGSVYDNDIAQKTVEVVSYLQNKEQIPQADAPGADPNRKTEIAAVSTDGSHILMAATTAGFCEFNAPPFNCPSRLSFPAHLYMRVNDVITYEVSPGADAIYQGMTEDGSKVFFTSEERLTNEDHDNSVDLYEWNEGTGSLKLLSQGNGNGNTDECNAIWDTGCDVKPITTERPDLDDKIAAKSGDIYFYSPEQLDPDNPGVKNERNLYVYRDGAVHYVTTMDPGTQVDRMQISPNGSHMAFLSRTQATAYVNEAPNDHGEMTKWEEMYTFDPSTGRVVCASCIPSGEPPHVLVADTGFAANGHNYNVRASQSGRFMADDGRVAFSTADPLVEADTNEKIDVYEFVDSHAQLITSGTGERDTQGGAVFYPTLHTGLEGISHDGVDLYFSTFETLVPEDLNGSFVKFYDARSGGGFPITHGLLPCTAADECHGDASEFPPPLESGTSENLGSGGNHPTESGHRARQTKPHQKKHHRKHHRRRHHHRAKAGQGNG